MAAIDPVERPDAAEPASRAPDAGGVNAAVVIGGFLAFGSILLAVFGPLIAPYPPMDANPGQQLLAPSGTHWFGTDDVGMDVFSRVIAAPRIDLGIALSATVLALVIGTAIGGIAGYFRTWWSEAIMRISDLIQSFPVFILAMVLVTITGQEIWIVVVVIAFVNVPLYVRLIRAELLSLRERTFVEAAIVLGVPPLRIIRRHLIPNVLGIIINQASITMGVAMLLTAGLSFVGAGVRVPTPEWGLMIATGASSIVTGQWWPSVFPGIALSLSVFGFALFGDGVARMLGSRERGA
ncbi:MAG: ABC transporter permease [Immundisolibacterales bacterium]|nr:ABC transporter permease [Immundisolibacterales bacterium]